MTSLQALLERDPTLMDPTIRVDELISLPEDEFESAMVILRSNGTEAVCISLYRKLRRVTGGGT